MGPKEGAIPTATGTMPCGAALTARSVDKTELDDAAVVVMGLVLGIAMAVVVAIGDAWPATSAKRLTPLATGDGKRYGCTEARAVWFCFRAGPYEGTTTGCDSGIMGEECALRRAARLPP